MWGSPVLDRLRPAAGGEPIALAPSDSSPEPAVTAPKSAVQTEKTEHTPEQPPVGAHTGDFKPAPAPLSGIDPDWLEDQQGLVWRSMAELWQDGTSSNAIASACKGLFGTGYACLHDQGNWSRIRKLGLPVILVLQDDSRKLLVLHGFSQEGLLVGSGDDVIEVSRDSVEMLWLGEYMVTWPQAPDWPGQILRGESGAAVDIVLEMAGFADPAWSGADVFDSGFESWLRTFQRRNGLKADGIVGPNTLIYLMAPTISQPRLILAAEERS
jgi:peptidoglycan hydrolase-like protein with peptidoglycan-binding domain